MQARITQNWRRPPSARNGMEVLLIVSLVPTGEVVGISVSSSSGSTAFDRSAIAAVERVARFPEVTVLSISDFERYFRRFPYDSSQRICGSSFITRYTLSITTPFLRRYYALSNPVEDETYSRCTVRSVFVLADSLVRKSRVCITKSLMLFIKQVSRGGIFGGTFN